MSFDRARAQLTHRQITQLNNILHRWRAHQSGDSATVANLEKERCLPMDMTLRLLHFLLHNAHQSIPELKRRMRDFFRRDMQLKGGVVRNASPKLVGTVLPYDFFKNYLLQHHGRFFAYDEALVEEFLQDLLEFHVDTDFDFLPLRHATQLFWFNWNKKDSGHPPYTILKSRLAEKLRVVLGLGEANFREQKLLAFTFSTRQAGGKPIALFRPTFCDADLSPYFCPPPTVQSDHGWTRLLPHQDEQPNRPAPYRDRIPQAVAAGNCVSLKDLKGAELYF